MPAAPTVAAPTVAALTVAAPTVAALTIAAPPEVHSELEKLGMHPTAVECRGAFCRIETVHDDNAAANERANRAFQGQLWNGAALFTRVAEPNGRVRLVTFLAREGASLPPPS